MKIPQSDPSSSRVGTAAGSAAPVHHHGRTGRAGTTSQTSASSATSAADQTSLAASVVSLTAQALSMPDVRTSLVQGLRQQIAGGTYQPSPSQIAGRMLADPLSGLHEEVRG